MTIKESILKSLEDIGVLTNYIDVYNHIVKKKYCEFKGETPTATISAILGEFIRNGDTRVKRIKKEGGYFYYLTKNEQKIGVDVLSGTTESVTSTETSTVKKKVDKVKTYAESDLHKLLSTYLKSTTIYSKTIPHQQSNGKDTSQVWTHPDMIGIKFLNLKNAVSESFLKTINRLDTFKLSSYEIKREINNDTDLKEGFFQAVSNSSWANFGYLVALEFNGSLAEEMERLNQLFGIGVIKLNAINPFQSEFLHQAKYRELNFKTIDKLCNMNKEFKNFIEQSQQVMIATERTHKAMEKELNEFCDTYFDIDAETEIATYCKEKHIPTE